MEVFWTEPALTRTEKRDPLENTSSKPISFPIKTSPRPMTSIDKSIMRQPPRITNVPTKC